MATVDLSPDLGQSGDPERTLVAGAAGVLRFPGPGRGAATMCPMRNVTVALVLFAALALAGCGSKPVASAAGSPATPATAPSTTARATPDTEPTAVPGGQTGASEPVPTGLSTTQTDWGEILDTVPATFPRYPGAKAADGMDGPVSQALLVPAADDAAAWYRDALKAKGYSVELSDALEDGSRVLDATSDLPECRIRMDFRPTPESTMISVLYAAGCAGLGS